MTLFCLFQGQVTGQRTSSLLPLRLFDGKTASWTKTKRKPSSRQKCIFRIYDTVSTSTMHASYCVSFFLVTSHLTPGIGVQSTILEALHSANILCNLYKVTFHINVRRRTTVKWHGRRTQPGRQGFALLSHTSVYSMNWVAFWFMCESTECMEPTSPMWRVIVTVDAQYQGRERQRGATGYCSERHMWGLAREQSSLLGVNVITTGVWFWTVDFERTSEKRLIQQHRSEVQHCSHITSVV